MDLLDIIIFSLKLFSLISIIVISVSYATYKFKARKKLKPYMRPTIVPDNSIYYEVEAKIAEELKRDNRRFVIMNQPELEPVGNRSFNYMPKESTRQFNKRQRSANEFNIYNHYSSSSFEPMHKIKL